MSGICIGFTCNTSMKMMRENFPNVLQSGSNYNITRSLWGKLTKVHSLPFVDYTKVVTEKDCYELQETYDLYDSNKYDFEAVNMGLLGYSRNFKDREFSKQVKDLSPVKTEDYAIPIYKFDVVGTLGEPEENW